LLPKEIAVSFSIFYRSCEETGSFESRFFRASYSYFFCLISFFFFSSFSRWAAFSSFYELSSL